MNILDYKKHKGIFKRLARKSYLFYRLSQIALKIYTRRGVKVKKGNGVKLRISNIGKENSFVSGENCLIDKLHIRIVGDNNSIVIGNNVTIKSNCRMILLGNDCTIRIGDNTTISSSCQLETQEQGISIEIGNDCMFSNHIHVRTCDSHFIYDIETGKRTNMPATVMIGNHVWIAAYATILKGVNIGDGAVIGYGSIVTKPVESKSVAVGIPAKVVQSNIEWTRKEKINNNYDKD